MCEFSKDGTKTALKETGGTGDVYIVKYNTDTDTDKIDMSSKLYLPSTSTCQAGTFSPLSTFFVTWQRPSKDPNSPGNLKIFSSSNGELLKSFHMKSPAVPGVTWPAVQWTYDEKIALRIATNNVFIHKGGEWDGDNVLERIHVEGVKQFSVSPGDRYRFTTFTPEKKGNPAKVTLYSYPNTSTPITGKSFYQAEEVTTTWSPNGNSVIVFTHTTVDTTGKSYYGSTSLHLLSADSSTSDYAIPLPKEGPVYDVKWSPDPLRPFFIVLSGMMPSQACLYNAKCEQLFLFGEAHRNTVTWSPSGRFVGLCGFGNLAGDMDFWDVNKKKKMGSNTAHCAVGYGWSPDSRKFMVSTTAPRMNVDNGVKFFKYNGAGPIGSISNDVLFEAKWRPSEHGRYPDRPQSPLRKGETPPAIAEKPKVARYRPPGAGKGGASFAERLRLEREGKGESKKVDRSDAMAAKYKAPEARGGGSVPGMPVGANPVEKEKSKNAIKREKQKKKKEEMERKKKEEAEAQAILDARAKEEEEKVAAEKANGPEAKEKRAKKIKKLLKQIAELMEKPELNDDQKKKVATEEALNKELTELGL